MNRCRVAWYEGGSVRRHFAGGQRADPANPAPTFPARLIAGPEGLVIVEAEIDGNSWFGTLAPKSVHTPEVGLVILHEKPSARD